MAPRTPASPGSRRPVILFAIGYLVLQLALPIRGFVDDEWDTASNFSWDMFADHWGCRGGYTLTTPDGQSTPVDYLRAFHSPWGAGKITYRDRLPDFHRWMCERIDAEGDLGRLEGRIACSLNRGPDVELIAADVDICSSPNYGVIPQ